MANYTEFPSTAASLPRKGSLVVPDANNDLPAVSKGLRVWAAGTLSFIPVGQDTVLGPFNVVAGELVPYLVRRVTAGTAVVTTLHD